MKNIPILLITLICCMLFTTCSEDFVYHGSKGDTTTQQDKYYVHYYCSPYSRLTYAAKNGEYIGWSNFNQALDITIGPVQKGFRASLYGSCSMNRALNPKAIIQVSKNGGPMVDKCRVNIITSSVDLSYVIDF